MRTCCNVNVSDVEKSIVKLKLKSTSVPNLIIVRLSKLPNRRGLPLPLSMELPLKMRSVEHHRQCDTRAVSKARRFTEVKINAEAHCPGYKPGIYRRWQLQNIF